MTYVFPAAVKAEITDLLIAIRADHGPGHLDVRGGCTCSAPCCLNRDSQCICTACFCRSIGQCEATEGPCVRCRPVSHG